MNETNDLTWDYLSVYFGGGFKYPESCIALALINPFSTGRLKHHHVSSSLGIFWQPDLASLFGSHVGTCMRKRDTIRC